MFATLLGGLPRPPRPSDAPLRELVRAAVEAQEVAGLEPVTDGGWWGDRSVVDAWLATAEMTARAVKGVVSGPYSSTVQSGVGGDDRRRQVIGAAHEANGVLRALVEAGCPLIEVHEPAIVRIGTDLEGWDLFRDAQAILTDGLDGAHLSLAIIGGHADAAGFTSILASGYASLAVDLIAGPDNWRLVRAAPPGLGIVCGAMSPEPDSYDGPETLLWAASYAASADGRGPDRVGLATASTLRGLPWDAAVEKLRRLGGAARLSGLPVDDVRAAVDPRAIDSRSAALGRAERPPSRRPAARPPEDRPGT